MSNHLVGSFTHETYDNFCDTRAKHSSNKLGTICLNASYVSFGVALHILQ